ncbi:MAG TPA: bifunctional precorrin-2 dehydrogenase/sirohydrochlorin ferrochelatase [Candidatus Ozemobacteraceae bacterium]|nr:bifunctional precorrin-2 dehydrogenase/sirohydrochlorin ferrochelatase [Candidatus Ozemobacteraceae bacterium]
MTHDVSFDLPVFLNVRGKPVLVVGGGDVALRKIRMLAAAGASIRIVAKIIHNDIYIVPGVSVRMGPVADTDFTSDLFLAVLATDDPAVQERSACICRERGILFNRCDVPDVGDFVTGSLVARPPVLAAVTASRVPAMARLVRERFERALEPALIELAELLEELRPAVKEHLAGSKERAAFFRRWATEQTIDRLREAGRDAVRKEMLRCLSC